ncbi:MAG: phosphopantetheine attachment site [Lachnospiraceae bacterium]|nr:phosphopantetheine attachment site [Lachnospiraceae bacterium]
MLEAIKTILEQYTTEPVTESSRLNDDLGIDSFFILHFLSEIEDYFHIRIDEMEYETIITVGDVMDRIRETR